MWHSLVDELILQVLGFLPLCELRNKTLLLNRRWHGCSRETIDKRLQKLYQLMDRYEFDPEEEAHRPSACILGNFDRSTGTKTMTALVLEIESFDPRGYLVYKPHGKSSFGLWMEQAGYIPITKGYDTSTFSFPPTVVVQFKFWFNPESTGTAVDHEFSDTPARSYLVPQGTTSVSASIGDHTMELRDNVGFTMMFWKRTKP
ncbi:hypothetical protein EDD86DRAFT_278124 [Gorgonomyces haynaldii]|nr:hypothetical protein EDD86DRAFT_278124 [Gorgonomyces haynaldii]